MTQNHKNYIFDFRADQQKEPASSSHTMNSISVQLNNSAVDALHAGHLFKGFTILSHAFLDAARRRHKIHIMAPLDSESTLQFSLKDCAATLTPYLRTSHSSMEGTQRFLCLKFLRIEISPVDESTDNLFSCAVTWALGYNLAIVYAMVGSQQGGGSGNGYLKKSLNLMGLVERQINKWEHSTPFWSILKLSILSNRICVLRECAIDVRTHLMAMKRLLDKSKGVLDAIDVRRFYLFLQFLDQDRIYAATAA